MTLLQAVTSEYEVREKLRDGQLVVIRVIHSDDKAVLADEMKHLSQESAYFRFLTPKSTLSQEELIYFSELDLIHHVGLLASIVDENGREYPAGTGRYIVAPEDTDGPIRAEVAFEVREEFQGLGIATLIFQKLIEIGQRAGIDEFVAYVLCENRKMIDVIDHMHLPLIKELMSGGVLWIRIPLNAKIHE